MYETMLYTYDLPRSTWNFLKVLNGVQRSPGYRSLYNPIGIVGMKKEKVIDQSPLSNTTVKYTQLPLHDFLISVHDILRLSGRVSTKVRVYIT